MRGAYALEDLEPLARRHLPRPIFGYVSGGAETLQSLRENRTVFSEIGFIPPVLRDVSGRSLEHSLMHLPFRLPFGIAPMGVSALTAYRGDVVLAQAARQAGIPMILSAASLMPMEKVVTANPNIWYQAYLPPDRLSIDALLARVARCGIGTLVVTVDTNVVPNRENNLRDGYRTPLKPSWSLLRDGLTHPRWAIGTFLRAFLDGPPHFENATATRGAPLLSRRAVRDFSGREFLDRETLQHVRTTWQGRLVLKGMSCPDDVAWAAGIGIDGVILSNHGGRQLDGTVSPMRTLRAAVAVAGGMPVMIDSGFRRGTDVLKALALGARFVFIGRPFNYAAAVAGQGGVDHAVNLLASQLYAGLGMLGKVSLNDLDAKLLLLNRFAEVPPPALYVTEKHST